uniref:WAP domain-containing protein n=1 Tax=Anopheles culicifacies TaxID=139723 RepID=A0A182M313_9DIPT
MSNILRIVTSMLRSHWLVHVACILQGNKLVPPCCYGREMPRQAKLAVVALALALCVVIVSAAGDECPLASKVGSCSPTCLTDRDCADIGGKCCANACNRKSCVERSKLKQGNKSAASSDADTPLRFGLAMSSAVIEYDPAPARTQERDWFDEPALTGHSGVFRPGLTQAHRPLRWLI